MKNPFRQSAHLALASIALLLLCGSALAVMPPHVTGTNVKDGVLKGHELIIHGYSLNHTNVTRELVITHATTKKMVLYTHKHNCKWVGKCDKGPPGSCQLKCILRVTLPGVENGARFHLRYLGTKLAFRVALKKK